MPTKVSAAQRSLLDLDAPPAPKRTRTQKAPPPSPPKREPARLGAINLRGFQDTNTLDGALRCALFFREGAGALWNDLRARKPSDQEVLWALRAAFGGEVGYRAPGQKGFYARGSDPPYFWWGGSNAASGVLCGAALVARVRTLLNL